MTPHEESSPKKYRRNEGQIPIPLNGIQKKQVHEEPLEIRPTKKWFDDMVARAKNEIVSQVIEITPSMAKHLLANNPDNRAIAQSKVSTYARDIRAGNWSVNGEPIIVSEEGLLNDGQHRCLAIVEAERPMKTMMTFGVPRESRFTTDQGLARTPGHFLGMKGVTNANLIAAACTSVWQNSNFSKLSGGEQQRPTKHELMVLQEKIGEEMIFSEKATPSRNATVFGGRSILIFCHYAISKASNFKDATEFLESLCSGADLSKGDPILVARNTFIKWRGRMKANEKANVIFRAWNMTRQRKVVKKGDTFNLTNDVLPELES